MRATSSNGDSVFSVSEFGVTAARQLHSAEDVFARGNAILGDLADWQPPSINRLSGHLDKIGRGVVAMGQQTATTYITTNRGLMDVAFKAERGRSYAIVWSGAMLRFQQANITGGLELRIVNPSTVDGVAPTPSLVNGSLLATLWSSAPQVGYVLGHAGEDRLPKTDIGQVEISLPGL